MTNIVSSIVAAINSFKLQRSRARALKQIRSVRASVRACGARPEPKSAFAVGKGLVWGANKFQAVSLEIRDSRTQDTDNCKWAATCTHAH